MLEETIISRSNLNKKVNIYILIAIIVFVNVQLSAKPVLHSRSRRNAYKNESRLWPKAIVPYIIDEAYTARERLIIETALKDLQSKSCIRFQKLRKEKAFVEIVRGNGCRAVVGYIGRRQQLTLGKGCIWVAGVLHELMHVLGFFHEHTRPDRDNFVTIHKDNIKSKSLSNFLKMPDTKVTTFGLPYDYNSVLHYHDREFAIDRSKKTIEPKSDDVGKFDIGKVDKLSSLDIIKLNKLYHCSKSKYFEEEASGDTELEDNFILV